ncbi:MAG: hypothetical protein ACD_78C00449G0001 [uncultured bacterium (gcode 4)]|uniref:Uncharacterized protein n=1 Tax=uncultured bacterium (gcode 4) TaxID=1234023 RepID=K1YA46_9BACT|nr:MAG: hypothetical protein ACD_78C00449G0001 [uncultured bacterium (gcode 4)]
MYLAADNAGILLYIHNIARVCFSSGIFRVLHINLIKNLGEFLHPLVHDRLAHFLVELGAGCEYFVVVLEHSNRFEIVSFHELNQVIEIFVGFTRESDDEARSDKCIGKILSDRF